MTIDHAPARTVALARISEQPLDVAAHQAAVSGPRCGGVVTFVGAVRDHDHGRAVSAIEYSAHPTAGAVLAEVAADVAGRSEAEALAVSHRIGRLGIGDAAIVVTAAAPHRAEAFAAAQSLVDEVKRRLPVWKHQLYVDGSEEWVACP